ncbi:anti-sigma factor family protein [Tumebacillus permanentifrigoris]|uniref:Anti-sigma-W factor RsiW n=1 Tax=Tumebacillus permanentifrigoris TaxID=378543 RepID=A0A316D608_9BACL|nr:zf-HC2 domain-containing protein [Tumebacillus permanentifrigoris]PWK07854.1 putative zinc finger protein [Tumebacillus permanentifrigoris]
MSICPYQSRIQAYLDGELPREERKGLSLHLDVCSACRSALHSLKRIDDWTESALREAFSPPTQAPLVEIDVDAAWTLFETRLAARTLSAPAPIPSKGRWTHMAKNTKKWLVGTGAAVVLVGSLAIPAVQAAADEVLSLFRAQKIQTIQVTKQDLNQMQEWISSGAAGEMSLQGLGKIWSTDDSHTVQTFNSAAEAQAAGYTPAVPTGFQLNTLTVRPEHTLHFQLNVERANALLKQLGSKSTLDKNLDNQDFSVHFPQTLITTLTATKDSNQHYTYTTFASPALQVPRGVDVNQLRETILQLPMLPENIRKQLASIEDWQHTVPVPTLAGSGQNLTQTTVNGGDGLYFTEGHQSSLYWQANNHLHLIESASTDERAITQDTLQSLAKSFK